MDDPEHIELSDEDADFLSLSTRERRWDNAQRAETKWPWRAVELRSTKERIYVVVAHIVTIRSNPDKTCTLQLMNGSTIDVHQRAHETAMQLGLWP